jgi:hypothetical protein
MGISQLQICPRLRALHHFFVKSLRYKHYHARLINRPGAVTPSADWKLASEVSLEWMTASSTVL